jgi:hypothetical protein
LRGRTVAWAGERWRFATVSPLLHASPTTLSFVVGDSDSANTAIATTYINTEFFCITKTANTNTILISDPNTSTATAYTAYTTSEILSPPPKSTAYREIAHLLAEGPLSQMSS